MNNERIKPKAIIEKNEQLMNETVIGVFFFGAYDRWFAT